MGMSYANLVRDANIVYVGVAAVLMIVKKYKSIELALPADGAAPPCHLGVIAVPSMLNAVEYLAVTPFVTANATVVDDPTVSMLDNVVPLFPRKLNVQLAEALLV
jgi:hypothetical protein